MGILTGREEGIRLLPFCELAFIGPLTDYAKGMSTRSLPQTNHYTLEFEKFEQIRGIDMEKEEPLFHYMQTGNAGGRYDPKLRILVPTPEPKRPRVGQLYLALLDEPQQITQLVEITIDDIDALREVALQK